MMRRRQRAARLVCLLVVATLIGGMYVLQTLPGDPTQQTEWQLLLQDRRMSLRERHGPVDFVDLNKRLQSEMLLLDSPLDNVTCQLLNNDLVKDKEQLGLVQRLTRALATGYISKSATNRQGDVILAQDCGDWRRRMGFHRWPVTPQEDSFPLAFSFKVHAEPAMFERFLSVLWRPQNWYCVHVDRKSPDDVFLRLQNVTRCFDNVVMTSVRHNVVHASIVSLHADLECAKLALATRVPWKYHVSSSGTEFLLKTNLEMVQILALLNGSNDIENYPPSPGFYSVSLLNRHKLQDSAQPNASLIKTNETRTPFKHQHVQIRKGCAYNSVTRPFLQWALTDKINQDLLDWLKDAWAADELFWATLSYRPEAPGGPGVQLTHENGQVITMATIWPWDKGHRCQGTTFRASCVFGSLDFSWLLTRHELLANKFSPDFDSTVLRCLEAELERRALSGYIAWSATWHHQQQIHHEQQQQQRRQSDSSQGDGPFLGGWPAVASVNRLLYQSFPHVNRSMDQSIPHVNRSLAQSVPHGAAPSIG